MHIYIYTYACVDGWILLIFFANHESHWGLCKHKTYLSQYLPFGGTPCEDTSRTSYGWWLLAIYIYYIRILSPYDGWFPPFLLVNSITQGFLSGDGSGLGRSRRAVQPAEPEGNPKAQGANGDMGSEWMWFLLTNCDTLWYWAKISKSMIIHKSYSIFCELWAHDGTWIALNQRWTI